MNRGGTVWIANWYDHYTQRRHDLGGFIDLIALYGPDTIGVQATTGANVTARTKKICGPRAPAAREWLERQNRIQVWGWSKYAKPVNGRWWRPRIVDITLEDLGA